MIPPAFFTESVTQFKKRRGVLCKIIPKNRKIKLTILMFKSNPFCIKWRMIKRSPNKPINMEIKVLFSKRSAGDVFSLSVDLEVDGFTSGSVAVAMLFSAMFFPSVLGSLVAFNNKLFNMGNVISKNRTINKFVVENKVSVIGTTPIVFSKKCSGVAIVKGIDPDKPPCQSK